MPFDPSLPATGSPLDSAIMRSQLTSLKALIDAISAITAAQVDGVTTVPPTDPALAQVSVVGNTLHFTFAIPMGQTGQQGQPGQNGSDGGPGDPATVGVTFDGTSVHFTFSIPRGAEGTQGPPGEVTTGQLDAAIATTATNPASVNPLSQTADPTYNPAQMQQVIDKLDEFLWVSKRV